MARGMSIRIRHIKQTHQISRQRRQRRADMGIHFLLQRTPRWKSIVTVLLDAIAPSRTNADRGKILTVKSDDRDDIELVDGVPSDAEIGDKAFSNPPSNLTDDEKALCR